MKVELKNVSINKRLSEETTCFSATLWIDGKRAAEATNRGHGDPICIRFEDREVERKFHNFCDSLPAVKSPYGDLKMGAELFVNELLDLHETRKACKKKTLFKLKSRPNETLALNKPFTAEWRAYVVKRYGDDLMEFVNETANMKAAIA